jgi:lipoprotein-anchoring transpeptidase ErfK/SrfK
MAARSRRLAALVTSVAVVVFAGTGAAWALPRTPSSVTLAASPGTIAPSQTVTLTATVVPAWAGQPVSILDGNGTTVASGSTDASGSYVTSFSPAATVTLHASTQGVESSPVTVTVTVVSGTAPRLTVRTGPARLFGAFAVTGTTVPRTSGMAVKVEVLLASKVVASKRTVTTADGKFAAAFTIGAPGRYRAKAMVTITGASSAAVSTPTTTRLPNLAEGAHGVFVDLLERRLVKLGYHLTGVDQSFDFRTADALMAFRKVQRLPRIQTVTAAVWRALAAPKPFVPRVRTPGFHIEVDQTRQVLALVRDGKAIAIIHVSTGKPSTPTYDGTFHVFSKLAGYTSEGLYYPSFFDAGRAIHGWPDVPTYAASHGCVRVPEWIATWIFGLDPIGTTVVVYH